MGKRRIEKTAKLLDREILVRWHPFELNPQIPREGITRNEYRVRKFGGMERANIIEQQLIDVGKQVGIGFRYDLMERTPNTRRAHGLLALALDQSVETQNLVAERLFTGYFLRGEDPGDPQLLLNVAKEMGLENVTGSEAFDDPLLQNRITQEEQQAHAKGVEGVPSMFLDGRFIASGAQPEQILANALRS